MYQLVTSGMMALGSATFFGMAMAAQRNPTARWWPALLLLGAISIVLLIIAPGQDGALLFGPWHGSLLWSTLAFGPFLVCVAIVGGVQLERRADGYTRRPSRALLVLLAGITLAVIPWSLVVLNAT